MLNWEVKTSVVFTMPMKTAVLKIYKPSKHKRAVMDYAFQQYTLAYDYLLNLAKAQIEEIKTECGYNGRLSDKKVASFLYKAGRALRHFPVHGSLKESLCADVAGSICSFIQLKAQDERTSFPIARKVKHRDQFFKDTLERMRLCLDDLEEENQARDDLLTVIKEQYMPIFFSRPDGIVRNRNFGLLYDKEKNKYYACVYLLPNESRHKKPISGAAELQAIHPQINSLKPSSRKVGYLLLPLAFGRWHEEIYLQYALNNPKAVRTAFLNKKGQEYFLHVTFQFDQANRDTQTFLGIDRGVNKLVALAVVDSKGNPLYLEEFSGKDYEAFQNQLTKRLRKDLKMGRQKLKKYTRVNEGFVHIIANRIINVADRFSSQVVLEDLTYLSKGGFKQKTGNKYFDKLMNRKLGRNPYNKLKTILDYKLPIAGLPQIKLIPGHYTSQTCTVCNHINKENRKSQAEFKCLKCGYEANADLNASINIARRGIWWQSGVVKKTGNSYIGKFQEVSIEAESYKEVIKKLQESVTL